MELKELAQDRASWCRWKWKPAYRGEIQQQQIMQSQK